MSLNIQFYLLIHTILYGAFIGLTFDTLNLAVKKVKRRLGRDFLIVLYWILQLPIAVLFFHRVNKGEFQSFLIIFVLLGGLLYFKIFQTKYVQDLKKLTEICFQVSRWVKKILNVVFFKPILFIFRLIFDIIRLPKNLLKKVFKKFFRKKRSDAEDDEGNMHDDGIEGNQESES